MGLTAPQLATLKAAILADANINGQPNNPDGHFFIAAYYNITASPDFWVWSTAVSTDAIMGNGFDWERIDNLTVGRARIWDLMTSLGVINAAAANVRLGILAAFNQGADVAMRLAVFTHCQRKASRVEKLFATGAGITATEQGVGPGTMVVAGPLTMDDVDLARNLP